MSKYTIMIIKDKDVLNGEDFNEKDIEAYMVGDILMLGAGTKRKNEDIIDISVLVKGDYRDLSRVNMLLVNKAYEEWRKSQEEKKC